MDNNQELISALADGQLRGDELARGVQAATADARARAAWCSYHLVGEVLRSGRCHTGVAPETFLAGLQQRLQQESAATLPVAQPVVVHRTEPAANDWIWKIAAGVASVAAVAAVGWNVWGVGAPSGQPQLAGAPAAASAVVEASAQPMVRDANLDKLLAAHRQFGGATAFGTTSGFLRNATFEGPAR